VPSAPERLNFSLSPAQKADARDAIRILGGSSITLAGAAMIAVGQRRDSRSVTIDQALSAFLAAQRASGNRPKTLYWYENTLNVLNREHGEKTTDDLTRADLLAWINARPLGSRPAYLRAVRALFRWMASQEPALVRNDPSVGLSLPSVHRETHIRFLSVPEADKLLRGCGVHLPSVALSLFAGIRPEEIAARGKPWLPWSCVDEVGQMVRVPAECAKTRRARIVEGLPPALWAWLGSRGDGQRDGTVGHGLSIQVARKSRTVLGLPKWPQDVLRHTFATYAVALTSDAAKVSLWLGHEGSTALIHRHYRGLATKAQAEAFFALRP
jgi:integrase